MVSPTVGVAAHFEDLQQQREAAELGMWLFLATEFMFFGGLFLAYLIYRFWYPAGFAAGSHTMNVPLGAANTAVLLTSSLTMALAVHATNEFHQKRAFALLMLTMLLGTFFLVVKGYEYSHKYEEHLIPFAGLPFQFSGPTEKGPTEKGPTEKGPTEKGPTEKGIVLFLDLYFLMTGVHALHIVIGLVLLGVLVFLASRQRLTTGSMLVHNVGLYWHFVDLVWVYLFPLFYLVATRAASGGPPP